MTRDGRWTGNRSRGRGRRERRGGHEGDGAAAGPALRAVGLSRTYGRDESLVWAVDAVDLDVPAGQTLAVTGPSGCGKSTLLQLLGGLDRPTDGEVWLGGRRVDDLGERALARLRRRAVGFVFQAFHLMDELTAAENVELPALLAGAGPRAARDRAEALLDRVGLADRARHLPAELSGGQRQRVAIARALVNEPLVVLADEPTGNLDSAATHDILRLFGELRAAGQTLVVVTHDERVAATADRVVSLRDGTLTDDTRLTHGTGTGTGSIGSGTANSPTTSPRTTTPGSAALRPGGPGLGALLDWGED
ncbi:ABC transporter ATP-binding protein [Streptomyces sp. JW3]|uniref:ABC transporter ATP-binding protein n=1 Tax=Streptomyces sp. JW3 TaxID=3456955 RepID=UPI003FA44848